jgi:membrane fusion protein, multidrug efflux system
MRLFGADLKRRVVVMPVDYGGKNVAYHKFYVHRIGEMNEMTRIEGETLPKPKLRRRLLMWSVPLLILGFGGYLWLTGGKSVTTDNAMIGAPVVSVTSEVSGQIVAVNVKENQIVQAGDLLFRIDDSPYRIAELQAQAAIANAQVQVAEMQGTAASKDADATSKGAMISMRASAVNLARENLARQNELMRRGFTTRVRVDDARNAVIAAQQAQVSAVADRTSSIASARAARAKLGLSPSGQHPQIMAAMAMLEKARLDLRRTEIHAPIGGRVTQTDRLQPGNMALQAFPSLSIVGGGEYWIEANFKETQLSRIRMGQAATVEIDAIPGKVFQARVSSIGAGTGSQFSMLPAQNATGNWVKVTQRVPVRLQLLDKPDVPLVAGWSAEVKVQVAK